MILPSVGSTVPDVELVNHHGETVRIGGVGRAQVLVFFPWAFSGICTSELRELQDEVVVPGSNVYWAGISVDSRFALSEFAYQNGIVFDLLSDFWPHGAVAREFGVFEESSGTAHRSTLFIDEDGIVREHLRTAVGEARSIDAYNSALASLGA